MMGNPKEEEAVFQGFLRSAPLFAGVEVSKSCPSKQEPADIECDLVDGRKVGVQLTTWLDEAQMRSAKWHERIELSLLGALEPFPLPSNEMEHISAVWVYAKRRLKKAEDFRTRLLQFIAELDKRWEREPEWQSPHGFQVSDFSAYPILAKYLDALEVRPRTPSVPSTMRKGSTGWLILEPRGGSYSPDEMVDALRDRVKAKIDKYPAIPSGMNEFYLLVHYDKAWEYNSPVKGIQWGFAEAIKAAAARIGSAVGVFDKIFVYVPVNDGRRAFPFYPAKAALGGANY
jgi:hypothetical protein